MKKNWDWIEYKPKGSAKTETEAKLMEADPRQISIWASEKIFMNALRYM